MKNRNPKKQLKKNAEESTQNGFKCFLKIGKGSIWKCAESECPICQAIKEFKIK